tara:strand:- start:527 stop:724 length:198 start_codon:yes stop_codon:yes gene_type:complete
MSYQKGDAVSIRLHAGARINAKILKIRDNGRLVLEVAGKNGEPRVVNRSPVFVDDPIEEKPTNGV